VPNWCNNTLVVHGEPREITRFYEACKKGKDDSGTDRFAILPNLYPVPADLSDTMAGGYSTDENGNERPEQVALDAKRAANTEKYGYPDWYDWSVAKWGTKWPDDNTDLVITNPTTIWGSFSSAWAPPAEGFRHISSMFPTLTFALWYEEGGMGFMGLSVIENGYFTYDAEGQTPDAVDENGDWDDMKWSEGMERRWDYLLAESELSDDLKKVININNYSNNL